MSRELKRRNDNVMPLRDGSNGEKVDLFYRQPTAQEYIEYQKNYLSGRKGEVNIDFETRGKFGLKIITGIQEKYFTIDGEFISSNPDCEWYSKDWKQFLEDTAMDLVQTLGQNVFEGTHSIRDEERYSKVTVNEEVIPFPKNSAG